MTATKTAPGPKGVFWFGSAFEAWKDPLALFARTVAEYGHVAQLQFGPYDYVVLDDPDAVKHVLVDNAKNYTKSRNYNGLKLVLGQGLVTSEGDFWRRQRKLAQPAFHRDRLAGFVESMASSTTEMLARWESQPARTDVHHEMMRLTFDIVGRTLFSTKLDDAAGGIGEAITIALVFANDYAESIIPPPTWLPTPNVRRFKKASRVLDAMVLDIIASRRAQDASARPNDLLDMLMAAQDEDTREGMTDKQLRDEVMTLVLAGHETTANALTWTFCLLSRHPDVARRVRAEVDEVLGDREVPDLADLPRLALTKRVIEESLRLYPPVWAFERQAIEEDEVLGYRVPKGAIIGICPYMLHRHEAFWENPEGFDPDRFLAADRPRYTYLPFGGGARTCIGNAFAMMEAQIVLATVVKAWDLELVPGARVELSPVVTLRPKHGMPMTVKRRQLTADSSPPAVRKKRAVAQPARV